MRVLSHMLGPRLTALVVIAAILASSRANALAQAAAAPSASEAAATTTPPAAPPTPAPGEASAAEPAPTPAPTTSVTVPAPASAPLSPPAPAPSPPTAPVPAAHTATSPGSALVHVAVSHRDAWLETRSSVDGGAFQRTCRAPCDIQLLVEGREARVVAPGMTTSNVFRFDAGGGVAGVRVDGGSASARRVGIITLAVGIPLALAGMALFAQGRVKESSALQGAGIAGLALGGAGITVSLPLLLIGTTHVKNAKGSLIALGDPSPQSL
jgi:hypothetical protein